jgi:hypothetical protein
LGWAAIAGIALVAGATAVVEVTALEQAANVTSSRPNIMIPTIFVFTSNPPTLFHSLSFERYLQYNASKPSGLLIPVSFSPTSHMVTGNWSLVTGSLQFEARSS